MNHIARSVRLLQWCIGFAAILIAMTIAAAGRAQTATNGQADYLLWRRLNSRPAPYHQSVSMLCCPSRNHAR